MSNGTPPIQPAPVPPSVAGIPQPVFASGSATSPAPPIPITGSPLLPPPQVGMNGTVPPRIPATTVPPSIAGIPQPTYGSGSATVPTAASLFPAFTAAGPRPPIVVNSAQNITLPPSPPGAPPAWVPPPALPLPTTPGTSPIPVFQDGWGRYAGPNPATPWPKFALEEDEQEFRRALSDEDEHHPRNHHRNRRRH